MLTKNFTQYVDEDIRISVRVKENSNFCKKSEIKFKIKEAKYRQSPEGKAADIRAVQSPKGKARSAKHTARRERDFGYDLMNQWFDGSNGHHIDADRVLYIPEDLHRSIRHSQNDNDSMMRINEVAFKWFASQEAS